MMLKTCSHVEVTEILDYIRAGIDVESVVRYMKDGRDALPHAISN
jgi:hypothetical protein